MGPYFTLPVTERCNISCAFCFNRLTEEGGKPREMSLPEILDRLRDVKRQGFHTVSFSGGEPTLHPDLPEAAREAERMGFQVLINTNGLRFAEKGFLARFKGIRFKCLLSFHSHKRAKYNELTRSGGYDRAVEAIRLLLRSRVPVTLSHVLSRQNYKDFPDWVRFVRERLVRPLKARTLLGAEIFFNQEVDRDGSLVRFSEAEPHLRRGLRVPGVRLSWLSSCTVSECLLDEGFLRRKSGFSRKNLRRTLEGMERAAPAALRDLLNYFFAGKCLSCERFLNPHCKGIRTPYLLAFGPDEYEGLLTGAEKALVSRARRRRPDARAGPGGPAGTTPLWADRLPESRRAIRIWVSRVLGAPEAWLRREALSSLSNAAALPEEAASSIMRLAGDPDPGIRQRAVETARHLPARAGARVLASALADGHAEVRLAAVRALAGEGLRKAARPAFFRALRDKDVRVRREALRAVLDSGLSERELAVPLTGALDDQDADILKEAVHALSRMRPPPSGAADGCVRALTSPDLEVRTGAVCALGRMEPTPSKALAALRGLLRDPSGPLRKEAVSALAGIRALPDAAVEDLIRSLADRESDVREAAENVLTGPRLRARSLPGLVRALRSSDPSERRRAAAVLERACTEHSCRKLVLKRLTRPEGLPPEAGPLLEAIARRG